MGKHIHTEDVERTGHAHDCRSSLAPAAREGLKIKNSGTQWVGGLHRQYQRRRSALDEQRTERSEKLAQQNSGQQRVDPSNVP